MSHTIRLNEKEKQAQFFVENQSTEDMPVLITLAERIQKEDGSEETPTTQELVAFPPQLIIPAKEKRSIRVSWKGETPKHERAFRLIAEQLPLDVKKEKTKGSGIKMLLKYVAALYVNPGKTKAELHITKVNSTNKNLLVTIENKGSMHAPMLNPIVTLTKDKQKVVLKGDLVKGLVGENLLAKSTRTFKLPANKNVDGSFAGKISID